MNQYININHRTHTFDLATFNQREKLVSFGTRESFFFSSSNPASLARFPRFVVTVEFIFDTQSCSKFDFLTYKSNTFS